MLCSEISFFEEWTGLHELKTGPPCMTTPIALRQEIFDGGNEEKRGGDYVVAAVLPTGRTTQAGTSRPGLVGRPGRPGISTFQIRNERRWGRKEIELVRVLSSSSSSSSDSSRPCPKLTGCFFFRWRIT